MAVKGCKVALAPYPAEAHQGDFFAEGEEGDLKGNAVGGPAEGDVV